MLNKVLFILLLCYLMPVMAESQIGGKVEIKITNKSIVNKAINTKSKAITQIGVINNSRVKQAVKINITTGNIINIANGYKTIALISIGSLENSQTDKVENQIYTSDIYNVSSGQEQTNTVIIGYHP